jgi:hypothetical protein
VPETGAGRSPAGGACRERAVVTGLGRRRGLARVGAVLRRYLVFVLVVVAVILALNFLPSLHSGKAHGGGLRAPESLVRGEFEN